MKHMVVRALAGCALLILPTACGPSDPRLAVLEQRTRWEVQPLEWVETPDGDISLSARLSGPTSSQIERFTVRIDLTDADGEVRGHWHSFDLSSVPRGGPKDVVIRVPGTGREITSLDVYMAYVPTPEDEPHIVELQGLPAAAD